MSTCDSYISILLLVILFSLFLYLLFLVFLFFFFFNDTATTEIYTLSLHDALPIWFWPMNRTFRSNPRSMRQGGRSASATGDRKSTRLNSSHGYISYAVFCLKKKKKKKKKQNIIKKEQKYKLQIVSTYNVRLAEWKK